MQQGSLPETLPPPPPDCDWAWIDSLSTAAPVPKDWATWEGEGELFGMQSNAFITTPDCVDLPPTPANPHAVGLTVVRYCPAFTQSVVKVDPPSLLAEFFIAMHMQRAAPAGQAPPGQEGAG